MFFQDVPQAQPDPIFGLLGAFTADPRPQKVNLMVGIYKDDHLRAELLPSVRKAKERIASQDLMADYLPIDGLAELGSLLGELVFGEKEAPGIYVAHTTGGTGALRVGAELLAQEVSRVACIPNHTWPNHRSILEKAGCKVELYPYYQQEKKGFDLAPMLAFLEKLPEKAFVILHACCHNPTGCDPTLEEWKEISNVMKRKKLFPFFDFAYQGLGSGLTEDAEAVRLFLREGHEMLIAYSCSKNFSMYCHRVGALFAVSGGAKERVGSQIKRIIRTLYSNPPAHGARIVVEVLKHWRPSWEKDLADIRQRIDSMRKELICRLESQSRGGNFDYLRGHKGMFSFIDLAPQQVQRMIREFAIYLTDNGRISVAGLTSQNIDSVVSSLLAVCGEQ